MRLATTGVTITMMCISYSNNRALPIRSGLCITLGKINPTLPIMKNDTYQHMGLHHQQEEL
jgi:hypothetical protein